MAEGGKSTTGRRGGDPVPEHVSQMMTALAKGIEERKRLMQMENDINTGLFKTQRDTLEFLKRKYPFIDFNYSCNLNTSILLQQLHRLASSVAGQAADDAGHPGGGPPPDADGGAQAAAAIGATGGPAPAKAGAAQAFPPPPAAAAAGWLDDVPGAVGGPKSDRREKTGFPPAVETSSDDDQYDQREDDRRSHESGHFYRTGSAASEVQHHLTSDTAASSSSSSSSASADCRPQPLTEQSCNHSTMMMLMLKSSTPIQTSAALAQAATVNELEPSTATTSWGRLSSVSAADSDSTTSSTTTTLSALSFLESTTTTAVALSPRSSPSPPPQAPSQAPPPPPIQPVDSVSVSFRRIWSDESQRFRGLDETSDFDSDDERLSHREDAHCFHKTPRRRKASNRSEERASLSSSSSEVQKGTDRRQYQDTFDYIWSRESQRLSGADSTVVQDDLRDLGSAASAEAGSAKTSGAPGRKTGGVDVRGQPTSSTSGSSTVLPSSDSEDEFGPRRGEPPARRGKEGDIGLMKDARDFPPDGAHAQGARPRIKKQAAGPGSPPRDQQRPGLDQAGAEGVRPPAGARPGSPTRDQQRAGKDQAGAEGARPPAGARPGSPARDQQRPGLDQAGAEGVRPPAGARPGSPARDQQGIGRDQPERRDEARPEAQVSKWNLPARMMNWFNRPTSGKQDGSGRDGRPPEGGPFPPPPQQQPPQPKGAFPQPPQPQPKGAFPPPPPTGSRASAQEHATAPGAPGAPGAATSPSPPPPGSQQERERQTEEDRKKYKQSRQEASPRRDETWKYGADSQRERGRPAYPTAGDSARRAYDRSATYGQRRAQDAQGVRFPDLDSGLRSDMRDWDMSELRSSMAHELGEPLCHPGQLPSSMTMVLLMLAVVLYVIRMRLPEVADYTF